MKWVSTLVLMALVVGAVSCRKEPVAGVQTFPVTGVVELLKPDGKTVVIRHAAISNYMEAMTMPFTVKERSELTGLLPGDEISFRLQVAENESWIDQIRKSGKTLPTQLKPEAPEAAAPQTNTAPKLMLADIPDFALTNEFGQRVSLHQFKGQALAFTFFFTRCPIPEYCPRLAKNFEGACQKLNAMPHGPTNWQLLSISFDPLDRPEVLKAYAERYRYDSNHWHFVTGNPDHIRELTRGFGVGVTNDGFFINHDFATVVFDTTGRLQNMWRFGGDTTDILVNEMIKATALAAVSN
jgi:protein SCO1